MANPELTRQPSALDRKARRLVRAVTPAGATRGRSAGLGLVQGLAWFSIGLGLVELLATRPLARGLGLAGRETLLRAHGVREVGVGLGLLAAQRPATAAGWTWARVAGDVVDLATLGAAIANPRPRNAHPLAGVAAVVGVAVLDVACARALQDQAHAARQTTDYRDRSGLPLPPHEMRGAALDDFHQPDDMRASPRLKAAAKAAEVAPG